MPSSEMNPQTLYDKVLSAHVVEEKLDGTILLYIDRHLVHEVTSPQAFEGLRNAGRQVRRPDCTLATTDHNVPTTSRKALKDIASFIKEDDSRTQCMTLKENVKAFGITYFGLGDKRQGIVHVINPEQGFTLPSTSIICSNSYTSTYSTFSALAFSISIMDSKLSSGIGSKDIILYAISQIGMAGGTGAVIKFCGPGTSPKDIIPITSTVPNPKTFTTKAKKAMGRRILEYIGLTVGIPIEDIIINKVFIGSYMNSRIKDIRAAATVIRGKKIATNIQRALVIPGSGLIKTQAENEGLNQIFITTSFE
ncbi:hypothetical protein FANTH_7763 [Fusarium anthophilum]|uniref:3-isopropylmalate dehydratase n=1 Tax=Fusarium anthophilum TaxID=48485 RepID=A0A8H4ZCV7_9HYPO|nr:hypothetical protein FANTH_7763 [Fusarium anthophilum]